MSEVYFVVRYPLKSSPTIGEENELMGTTAVEYAAPKGAHFELRDTKTARSKEAGAQRPILTWDDLTAMAAFYGTLPK